MTAKILQLPVACRPTKREAYETALDAALEVHKRIKATMADNIRLIDRICAKIDQLPADPNTTTKWVPPTL